VNARLPLDDQQLSRHAMGQLAEQTKIMHEELNRVGFSGSMADEMVKAWWSALMAQSVQPDFSSILSTFLKTDEEDDT
jgi:hypothetical protein